MSAPETHWATEDYDYIPDDCGTFRGLIFAIIGSIIITATLLGTIYGAWQLTTLIGRWIA